MADVTFDSIPRLRIGVTQRRIAASDRSFARDAIDVAWSEWFAACWPDSSFLTIPNFSEPNQVLAFIQDWGLNFLVLSGGEDVGSSPARDSVEAVLVAHARARRLPLLGVCRGMQLLHCLSGGVLHPQDGHLGQVHSVALADGSLFVNSWHRYAITELTKEWHPLAVAEDGTIEAMEHCSLPWLGLMWHPERPDGSPVRIWQWIRRMTGHHDQPGAR